jgi:hypothetical protein
MAKEKRTYVQQKAGNRLDALLKRRKKGEVIKLSEIEMAFPISPIIADCINDLDMRIQKLEQALEAQKVYEAS